MRNRITTWGSIFGSFTAIGLLLFCYKYLDDLINNKSGTFLNRLIEEMTGAYSMALLFPLVVWFVRKYRLHGQHWERLLPLHVLGVVVVSFAHTSLNWISRYLIFPLVGMGDYDYGILRLRYPMELAMDVITYSLLIILIHLFDHYRESRARELRLAQLETRLARAQLQTLRLQLQPHFLFNALNTISSILYDDVQAADRMIARLSDFLRLTLRTSEAQEVTLRQELEFLDLYLEIMRMRFEDRLKVDFAVPPETLEALTPQLILQPLVENSIKHAADPLSGHIQINVCARRENGSLWLEVCDAGPGIQANRSKTLNDGFGLANTVERLQQLYGTAQTLTLENAALGGLCVKVKIPFHTTQLVPDLNGDATDDDTNTHSDH